MNRGLQIAAGIAGVLVLVVVAFVGFVASRPSTVHVERSGTFATTPADVYPFANDFKAFLGWNPWTQLEPSAKVTLSDPPSGVGAWYTWEGEQTGKGRMAIKESVPNEKVVSDLQFIVPFEANAVITFSMTPEGDKTKVVWAYDATADFGMKAMGVFMSMDSMLGPDFEKGIANLGPQVEAATKARLEKEAAEKAAAEKATADASTTLGDAAPAAPAPAPQ